MIAKILVRSIATFTCVAVMATGWDAEAACRRRCRTACCYYEPVCCEPVCTTVCAPACTTVCAPACNSCCVTYVQNGSCYCRTACDWTVVQETVILPATSCCVATSTTTAGSVASSQPRPKANGDTQAARKADGIKATSTSLQR